MKEFNLQILQIKDGKLHLEGNLRKLQLASGEVMVIKNEKDELFDVGYVPMAAKASKRRFFTVDIPIYAGARYGFYIKSDTGKLEKVRPLHGKFSRLTNLKDSCFIHDAHIFKAISNEIRIYENAFKTRIASTYRYNQTIKSALGSDALRLRKKAEHLRKNSKPIWIVSDRSDLAGDNGEVLFKYLMECGASKDHDIFFLISEDCNDYARMTEIGPVLKFGTEEHYTHVLASSINISSSGDEWVFNPFMKDYVYYRDLMDSKFVFLQHGVIKDDLSGWLLRNLKNISIFVTSAKGEYDSICTGNYGYDESVVKLTGLPRHDLLTDNKKPIVAIMPSWRSDIASPLVPGTSEHNYSDTFRESSFFKFYNELINDSRLIEAMKNKGYTGIFYLHPNHRNQACDFTSNDVISVWNDKTDYTQVFNESALLVTDYSSVAMDFAYLRKPIVYTHFDKEEFFRTHTYKEGYFDYVRDGFGPVCNTYEETVEAIIGQLNNGCTLTDLYRERIDSFLTYSDNNNCKRVYEEIKELED